MLRITIKDKQQTVSFPSSEDTMLRLVAGCSASPSSLGELLVATDIYQRGIAAAVMADLMEFDKTLRREGTGFIHEAIRLASAKEGPLDRTFQVIDEATEREAHEQRGRELVLIDLNEQAIHASSGLEIPATGEVRIHDGEGLTDRTVTYTLPQDWEIKPL